MNEQIQEWFNTQQESTPDKMLCKEPSAFQIMFARDVLKGILSRGLEYERARNILTVISEHTSKSVRLPVYNFDRSDIGLRVIARNNFYDWKISVISDSPINADFSGLFHTTYPLDPKYTGNPLTSVYFEGFPEELIFGYYEGNHSKFSAEIGSDEDLYTTLFLIMRALGQIQPFKWSVDTRK